MTNNEFVDIVIGRLKSLNKDDRISKRLILSTGLSLSATYHAQRIQEHSISLEDRMLTRLDCVDMIEEPSKRCGGRAIRCKSLMRSKNRIEGLISGKIGSSLVISVTNITDEVKFIKKDYNALLTAKPSRYAHFATQKPSYFMFNDYLYIVDYPIEAVNVIYLSLQRNDKLDENGNIDKCASKLDYTFVCSSRLLQFVIDDTVRNIAMIKQITSDETPDLNNNNKK